MASIDGGASTPRRRPRIYYGWIIVAAGFVTLGVTNGIWTSFGIFFVAVVQETGWSRASTALAMSIYIFMQGVTGPLIGWLMTRLGVRRLMMLGAVLCPLALASCSLITEQWHFYITFGVLTSLAGSAVSAVPNYVLVSRWFVRRRGLALGLVSSGIGAVGMLLFTPLNQQLISTFGWRTAYGVQAALVLAILPPVVFFLYRDKPEDLGLLPDGDAPNASARAVSVVSTVESAAHPAAAGWSTVEWTVARAIRTWQFWMLCFAFYLGPFCNQTVFSHGPAYYIGLGFSAFFAASVAGSIGLFSAPAKIGWGVLSDHLGRENVYTIGALMMLAGFTLLLTAPPHPADWLLYGFAFFFAAGYGMSATLNPVISADVFAGKNYGTVYGYLHLAGSCGAACGPVMGGLVYDLTGSYALAFTLAAALAAVACVAIWIAAPRRLRAPTPKPGHST